MRTVLQETGIRRVCDMFERVQAIEDRYEELAEKLCDPAVTSSAKKYQEVMKEYKAVEPVALKYREYKNAEQALKDAREMLEENKNDSEMREMIAEEIAGLEETVPVIVSELKILLLPKDPNDDRNVIVEIRGGAGGEEAALFAAVLFRMYSMYAVKRGYGVEVLNANDTELGGYKEISFMLTGQGAYSRLKYESGVHRVQRVPETETQGRIHTSTVTVAVLPEAEDVEVNIDPNDLKIDTFRSSGAGGQHINKTESAIRITHLPTGLVVECQDERSQYKNKDKAMKVLRSRLLEAERERQHSDVAKQRQSQVGTGDRSERIRTYNYPQGRVTDHRIGLTLYKIEEILNGNIDEIVDALITADRAKQLAGGEE